MNYSKKDYLHMSAMRVRAFIEIAKQLGKEHQITKMMDGLAWGRHHFETGPQPDLRSAVREMSALDGAFSILNIWARDNDTTAQRVMLDIYPRGFSKLGGVEKE